jgi:hypothetical protein
VPHPTRVIDITMLAMLPGRERTEASYRALLDSAGFTLDRVVPTPTPYAFIEEERLPIAADVLGLSGQLISMRKFRPALSTATRQYLAWPVSSRPSHFRPGLGEITSMNGENLSDG